MYELSYLLEDRFKVHIPDEKMNETTHKRLREEIERSKAGTAGPTNFAIDSRAEELHQRLYNENRDFVFKKEGKKGY